MKTSTFLRKTTPLVISTLLAASLTQAAENNPGIGQSTHVDKISVRQVSAPPLIQVGANGATYDNVSNTHFSIRYSANVKCKGLWDVHYFDVAMGTGGNWIDIKGKAFQNQPIGIYADTLAKYGIDSGKKSMSANSKTLGGLIRPEMRDAAIKQCNSEASKVAQQQNISLGEAMSKQRNLKLNSNWVKNNLRLYAWASCGKPQVYKTWLSVFDSSPEINVACKAKPYVKPIDKNNLPNQIDNQLQVTALTLKSDTTNYSGQCPKKVTLTGEISASKAGIIEYRWKSGNTQSILKKLTFNKAGKRKVTRTFNVQQSQQVTHTLATKGPGKTLSNPVNIKINCINTHAGNNLGVAPAAPKPKPVPRPTPAELVKKSDLTPGKSITIGNKTGNWGSVLLVDASNMNNNKRGDSCKLRMAYKIKNIGLDNAGKFSSRLFENNKTLNNSTINGLKASKDTTASGHIYLNDGTHMIGVWVDNKQKVKESKETNNKQRIQVKVTGCDDKRPSIRATTKSSALPQ